MRPNPPRMVTVVVAVLLTVIGLALVYAPTEAAGLVRQLPVPRDVERQLIEWIGERVAAYACLAGSPLLLIAGSLFRGL